jgi:hypothetical protein
MTNQSKIPNNTKKKTKNTHPGMMGDGTEEQNLNQRGNPASRVTKKDTDVAFRTKAHPPK